MSRRMKRSGKRRRIMKRRSALARTAVRQLFATKRFVSGKLALNGNDAVSTQLGGVNFTLTDVPSNGELTVLFDQYKIAGIAYRWVINTDPMVLTVKKYPRLIWVHDYDDSSAPGAFNDLAQYPKMREHWFTENRQCTKWKFIRPARAAVEYESATLSSYRPQWKGFIDCASNTAPHYGIKYYVDQFQTGVSLYLQCRYYLVFKNAR